MEITNKKILNLDNLEAYQLILLDDISINLKTPYNDLIKKIFIDSNAFANKFSIITSRNNYLCKLFDICVIVTFIEKFLENNKEIEKIKTSDYLLYLFLKKKYNKLQITIPLYIRLNEKFKYLFKNYIDLIKFFIKSSLGLINYLLFRKSKISSSSRITLIDSFIDANNLNKNSLDRNYTGINNFLNDDESKDIYFVPSFLGLLYPSRVNLAKSKSKLKLLFKNNFLKFSDYLKALSLIKKNNFHFKNNFLGNINVDYLLYKIHSLNKYDNSTFDAILNFLFIKSLYNHKIKIKLFISWFENQQIDKGYIHGLRNFYPKTKIKGYQGFIVSYDYNIQLIPSSFEIANNLCVDEIVVVGEKLKKNFKNTVKIKSGPAFRFNFLNDKTISKKLNPSILILLPVGYRESYNILNNVFNSLKFSKKQIHVKIKSHPLFKIKDLNFNHNNQNITYEFVRGKLTKNLDNVHVVLGNTTSALIESLVNFTPVIVIPNNKGITQNPIPKEFDNRLWKISYGPKNTGVLIDYFIDYYINNYDLIKKISFYERKNFFNIPTKVNVRKFLEL